jgi:hypothetical protein
VVTLATRTLSVVIPKTYMMTEASESLGFQVSMCEVLD